MIGYRVFAVGLEDETRGSPIVKSYFTDRPYVRLAAAILLSAIDEWKKIRIAMYKSGKKKAKGVYPLIKWFWSKEAEILLDGCDINPDLFRAHLKIPKPSDYINERYSWDLTWIEDSAEGK